jgi:hypothetical protein
MYFILFSMDIEHTNHVHHRLRLKKKKKTNVKSNTGESIVIWRFTTLPEITEHCA